MIKQITDSPGNYYPEVLFALASALFEENKKDEAMFWFFAAELRGFVDTEICEDKSVAPLIGFIQKEDFGPQIVQYACEDMYKRKKVGEKVLEWDENTPYNYDRRWINLRGVRAQYGVTSFALSAPQDEWEAIRRKTRDQYRLSFSPARPVFSADRKRMAYASRKGQKYVMVVDDQPGPEFDDIDIGEGSVVFSADGKRVAYMAKIGQKSIVVLDGKVESEYDPVGPLSFDANDNLEYFTLKDGFYRVVHTTYSQAASETMPTQQDRQSLGAATPATWKFQHYGVVFPVMPGAVPVKEDDEKITYTVKATLTDFTRFYTSEMFKFGWKDGTKLPSKSGGVVLLYKYGELLGFADGELKSDGIEVELIP